jgi:PAS domain S-box-containing protein
MFELFFERSTDPIWLLSPETGTINTCNSSAAALLGYENKQQLVGLHPAQLSPEFQPDGQRSTVAADLLLERLRCESGFQFEWTARARDGSSVPLEVAATTVNHNGRDWHILVSRDVAKRKRMEEESRELTAVLERRVAERTAELSASEARLRTLVDHAPEAIVVFDGRGRCFLNCNNNALRLFGMSREELLQHGPADLSPEFQPDGRTSCEAARAWIAEAIAGGTPAFEWIHRRKDGTLIPCEVRLVRLPGPSETLIRGSIIDNTERRRKERIQEATYRISEAVHSANDLQSCYRRIHETVMGLMPARNFYIALFDPRTQMFSFPYFVDEFDARPEPKQLTSGLTGQVIRSGKPLLVNSRTKIQKLASGLAILGQERVYMESGTPAAVWLGAPLSIRGQTLGVMAVQDYRNEAAYGEEEMQILSFVAEQTALAIERKRAEENLRDSERRFRALFESTSLGVVLHDEEKLLAVNPAAVRLLGYEGSEQLLGRHPAEFYAPAAEGGFDGRNLLARQIDAALTQGEGHFECLGRTRQAAEFPVEVFLTRIEFNERRILQAVLNDISGRKQAETELLKALAQEKELNELKSSFVSLVSHEFRTPLGIIMSSAEILRDYLEQLEPEERCDHLQSIQKSARRMADLMEEALLLGRFEAGRMDFKPKLLDLGLLCERVVAEVGSATQQRCPIGLMVAPEARQGYGDEPLLRHVFINLLSNAVKYSAPGQAVDFELARHGQHAVCTVRDRGMGIAPEDQPWLFRAFYRGRNAANRPGTGLGLVIAKRSLELHGGTIELQSAVGQGTVFTARFPAFGQPDRARGC